MAYISITEVQNYLGRDSWKTTPVDEAALITNVIIPNVQALIDEFCNRTFEASTNTARTFHAIRDVGYGDGSYDLSMRDGANWLFASEILRTLWLDKDICQIASITNGDGTIISSSQYLTVPGNETPYYGILLKASANVAWTYSTDPEGAISISGKWAYSLTAPAVVKMAALRWVKFLYRQRDNDKPGEDQPRMSEGVWIMPTTIPKDIADYLKPLRRLV